MSSMRELCELNKIQRKSRVDLKSRFGLRTQTKESGKTLKKTLRIPYTIYDRPLEFHLVSHRTGMLHRETGAFA